jgi:hypothetical protein
LVFQLSACERQLVRLEEKGLPYALLIAFAIYVLLSGSVAAGACCLDPPAAHLKLSAPLYDSSLSSFRGIGLASKPAETRFIAHSLGFETGTSYFEGDRGAISSVDICKGRNNVGHAEFDRKGQMIRLSLKDRFFSDRQIFVRDFADSIFKRYAVRTHEVADDACFPYVTCFKGRSKFGEEFLIMRFGTEAELFVRPANRSATSF